MVELHRLRDGVWWFDLRPNGVPEFISTYILIDEKVAVVEPGPACGVPRLLEALAELDIAPGAVDWLLPTHIHLDHFGGGGQLLDACPNAVALVHPRGLRHVRDPARLWDGAQRVLGTVAEAYGTPAPLPPERSRTVEDGESVSLGRTTLRALHTPGHAPHHLCWISDRGEAWTGDAAGLWHPRWGRAFPVTPPRYHHRQALASLDRLAVLEPRTLLHTHFGPRSGAGALAQVRREQEAWMAAAGRGVTEGTMAEAVLARLLAERDGLAQAQCEAGLHQRDTNLHTVQGMMEWAARSRKGG